MIVERTYDEEEITSVITHPDIWERLVSDHSPAKEQWRPNLNDSVIALAGRIPELIGIATYIKSSPIVYRAHFQVLPEYRKEYALDFALSSVEWMKENTSAEKLVAEIPEYHPNVIGFAHKTGFVVEGINTQSIKKDGKLYNQFYMGLEL